MPFLLRACFLLPLAALLFMAVRFPAQARGDGKSRPTPTAVSPEPFHSENAPEAQAKRTRRSAADSRTHDDAIQQALERLRRPHDGCAIRRSPGRCGGNLPDVYMPLVTQVVSSDCNFDTTGSLRLSCVINVRLNLGGELLEAGIRRSSGHAQSDASALQAVSRTCGAGQFPPPPSSEYTELELVFKSDETVKE